MEPVFLRYNPSVKENPSQEAPAAPRNPFSAADTERILRERGWLNGEATPQIESWTRDAAEWLGWQAVLHSSNGGCQNLTELLSLIFRYDAASLLESRENQAVMAQEGARDVIRELANRVLAIREIDSDRLREIITALKGSSGSHGRKIFYPLRLALAGRIGEGELDRVILLLDRAAKLPFSVEVKGTCQRMLEFCAALS